MSNPPNPLSYASESRPAWRRGERGQFAQWAAAHFAEFFAGVFILGALSGTVALTLGSTGGAWIVAGALILASVIAATCRTQRRYRAYRIYSYLQQATRCHLPLPPMLAAAAQSEKGVLRQRLNRLNFALHDGAMLADAISFAVPEATQRHVALLYAAARNGDLPHTLDRLVDEHHRFNHHRTLQNAFMRVYFVIVFTGVGFVGWMLMIFVMPKFQQIMRDFGVPTPWAMKQFLEVSPSGLLLLTLAGYLLLGVLLTTIGRETLSSRIRRWSPMASLTGWITWYLPILGSQQRDRGLADVCDVIATALENGRPLNAAAAEASNLPLNAVLQSRVNQFADSINGGSPVGDAARSARLPALVHGLLGGAQVAGNLPQTFRFLQTYYASRFSRMSAIVHAAVLPAMAMVMGIIVLFIALAVITPMVTLMEASNPWGHTL